MSVIPRCVSVERVSSLQCQKKLRQYEACPVNGLSPSTVSEDIQGLLPLQGQEEVHDSLLQHDTIQDES